MSTTELYQQLAQYVERSKKIELLRNSEKYEKEKFRIEQLGLECYKEIYNTLSKIFNQKREDLLTKKKKYEESYAIYSNVTTKVNETTTFINSHAASFAPGAKPVCAPKRPCDPQKIAALKQEIDSQKKDNDTFLKKINDIPKKYIDKSILAHDTYYQAIHEFITVIDLGKESKRPSSLRLQYKCPTYKEILDSYLEDDLSKIDSTFKNLLNVSQKRKLDKKFSKSQSLLTVHKEVSLSNLKIDKKLVTPTVKPSNICDNLFNEKLFLDQPTRVWGYIPVKGDNPSYEIITKNYKQKDGIVTLPTVFQPNMPWSTFMRDAEVFIGFDSCIGYALLSIVDLKKGALVPPEFAFEFYKENTALICTLKTKEGESRAVLDKKFFMKNGTYNLSLISASLEISSSHIKFKPIDKGGINSLIWKIDELNSPTSFEVAVRCVTPDNCANVANDSMYSANFDKFMMTFSSATKIKSEGRFSSIASQLSQTDYYFYTQHDWCEAGFFVSALMGKQDRSIFFSTPKVTLLYLDNTDHPLQLDNIGLDELAIIVWKDLNGYAFRVYQKGTACFVDTLLPKEGYVVPDFQMRDFMLCLISDCYKCYLNSPISGDCKQERLRLLKMISKQKKN
ncbi:hypothetical protein EIN_098660 [Entamoeba invadens IP1]|uniref:Uncharacterized protein n=1 Tax=Entamoeba invadens IP1 TaxID=370355 RepID=A0A0A1U0V8_ENTIV|nr:hypothetical protein EIN_098660 [Entamoeba invadens IP1]ELP87539.1 hypothetical protein EIN_098660 [Entamoeba invadens IP1]|eukprot:XP_004254310.1 hypothetical protein EIN_098660 [Entamoeba invadens IP1]